MKKKKEGKMNDASASLLVVIILLISGTEFVLTGSVGDYGTNNLESELQYPNTSSITTGNGNSTLSAEPVPMQKTPHPPIRINNNTDFANQAIIEGWKGNGAQGNPYIIENYDIDGTDAGSCLYLGNTTVYFIVRNCSLHDASGNSGTYFWNTGLVLYNVTGGILENNTASNNNIGIWLYSSNNNIISNNNASSNICDGIRLSSSSRNKIANNTANSNNQDGILLYYSDSNTIENNTANSNNQNGIDLYSSSSNTITNNTANSNDYYGIPLYSSDSNTITNNTASNNYYGIYLDCSQAVVLTGNTMINDGIFIWGDGLEDWNTHTIDTINRVNGKPVYYWKNRTSGTVPAGAGEVILANCTGVTVENQNVSDGSVGILMGFSGGNTISNNAASANNRYGIHLYSSDSNTIENNNASNNQDGIYLYSSNNNTIINNTASNNQDGIYLYSSNSSTIINNTASNNQDGIYLSFSSNNTISNNTASNNQDGISLDYSQAHVLTGNTMINDGLFIWGYGLEDWNTHTIDTTNTVNGKPVYYWKNLTSGTVPAGAGEVILANCTGVTVENQNVSDGSVGILMGFSGDNTIANNTASWNKRNGIYLYSSSSNSITNNTASNNEGGIYLLYSSDSNTIANNTASSNNYYGIYLYYSNSNTISNNTASSNNEYGICLEYSSGNTIYHNNFINNINQAYDNSGTNYWNAAYPTGGNYWSDYNGTDNYSGPDQNISGPDGIGDTPYMNIGGSGAQDSYPLMEPPSSLKTSVHEGWNLITLPWQKMPTDIETALSGISWDKAAVYINNTWYTYNKARPAKYNLGFPKVDNTIGIWVNCTASGTLSGPDRNIGNTTILLHKGWNLIGYPSKTDRKVSDALSGIPWLYVETSDTFGDVYSLSSSDYMTVGKGYWIYVTADCTWTVAW